VMLQRSRRREIAVVEILDLVTDAGAAFRGHADKVAAIRREFGHDWRVGGLLVLRGTHRNRELVRSLDAVMRSRFPASSRAWLEAIRDPDAVMPAEGGFLWSGVRSPELMATRLRRLEL